MDKHLQRSATCIEQVLLGAKLEELRPLQAGKWSAAEILEHLTRAFTSTVKLLENRLASDVATTRRPTWRERWRILVVIEAGCFPTGVEAPKFTLPKGVASELVLPGFHAALKTMDQTLDRCEQRFGRGKIAAHFLFGPLSARQWRKFHWVHTRHHAAQLKALRQAQPG
jgi:hypothetical protein